MLNATPLPSKGQGSCQNYCYYYNEDNLNQMYNQIEQLKLDTIEAESMDGSTVNDSPSDISAGMNMMLRS